MLHRRSTTSSSQLLARLAKLDVLVLGDFLIAPLGDLKRRDTSFQPSSGAKTLPELRGTARNPPARPGTGE